MNSPAIDHTTDWFTSNWKAILAILIIILLNSCSDTVDPGYPYLKFDRNDTKTFINYQKGRILVFKSSTAPSRTYQVDDIVQRKSEYTVGMGFFSTYAAKYYDYDERLITFKNVDGKTNKWIINYQKRPSALDGSGKPDLSTAKLFSAMLMWEWNGGAGPIYPINLNDKTELVTLQIDNQPVPNVQKIWSNSLSSTKSSQPDLLNWDINVLYFTAELGIVGFGDVDGNTWLLKK